MKNMGPMRGRAVAEDDQEEIKKKRRMDEDESEVATLAPLPQKKRVLPSNLSSPSRKTFKEGQMETEDDEILIRETQAALRSLSGSWPHEQKARSDQEESPAFENLFEDKKFNVKMSPSSSTSSVSQDAQCALKDVITLRDQQTDGKNKASSSKLDSKFKQLVRRPDKDDGESPKPQEKYASKYEPPDFNELVDDSSNELEIDMSEPSNDKEDDSDRSDSKQRRKSDDKSSNCNNARQSLYSVYKAATALHPFSSTSAFRPPEAKHQRASSAYSNNETNSYSVYPDSHLGEIKSRHDMSSENSSIPGATLGGGLVSGKQYTLLQSAGTASKAATALQEAARGAPSVAAVSDCRPQPTLSPASLTRGIF